MSNTKPLDLNKPVQTRDGRPARIIATDLLGLYPVAAAIMSRNPETPTEYTESFTRLGEAAHDMPSDLDLVNVPPAKKVYERWINIYPNGDDYSYFSAEVAARRALGTKTKPTTIHIKHEYIEGENEA